MPGSPSTEALHAKIEGIVQGVGFRYFVKQQAEALSLTGWVRNRYLDESVEVWAEVPRPALEAFLDDLRRGPRSAVVHHISIDWPAATGKFRQFNIAPTE